MKNYLFLRLISCYRLFIKYRFLVYAFFNKNIIETDWYSSKRLGNANKSKKYTFKPRKCLSTISAMNDQTIILFSK